MLAATIVAYPISIVTTQLIVSEACVHLKPSFKHDGPIVQQIWQNTQNVRTAWPHARALPQADAGADARRLRWVQKDKRNIAGLRDCVWQIYARGATAAAGTGTRPGATARLAGPLGGCFAFFRGLPFALFAQSGCVAMMLVYNEVRE